MKNNLKSHGLVMLLLAFVLGGCSPNQLGLFSNKLATMGAWGMNSEARPNVLFILTDDHANKSISKYSDFFSAFHSTPNLDALANGGMLFQNAFVANSICAPSRAAILSGQYGHINGVPRNDAQRLHYGKVKTFPEVFQDNNYTTALVGKWHIKSVPRGFDYCRYLSQGQGQGWYFNTTFNNCLTVSSDSNVFSGGTTKSGYVTEAITNEAKDWLTTWSNQPEATRKPFLLLTQYKATHRSWGVPTDKLNIYDYDDVSDAEIPLPSTFFDDYATRYAAYRQLHANGARVGPSQLSGINNDVNNSHLGEIDIKVNLNNPTARISVAGQPGMNLKAADNPTGWNEAYNRMNTANPLPRGRGADRSKWLYSRYIREYLRNVNVLDSYIGDLVGHLQTLDIHENTIVVYISDQGFYLGEHGWFDKRWMYEESLRTPLIIKWPGKTIAGSQNNDLVMNLDIAPTLIDMAGISVPASMQGASLVPLLKGNTPADWREAIYYQYFEFPQIHRIEGHYGIRTKTHKLIHFFTIKGFAEDTVTAGGETLRGRISDWELFDLVNDPNELNDLYGQTGNENKIAELKAKLQELRAFYSVPSELFSLGWTRQQHVWSITQERDTDAVAYDER